MKAWFDAQPTGAEGRHQMPQLHLSDAEVHDIAQFLRWTTSIDTQNWPPRPQK